MKRFLIIFTLLLAVALTVQADRRWALLQNRLQASPGSISSTTNAFTGTSMTIGYPSGVAAGGALVLSFATDTIANVNTIESGWSLVASNANGSGGLNILLRATDGSETGSAAFGFSGTESGTAIMSFFPGVTTNLADGINTSQSTPGAGVAMTSASHTPSVNNCYVVSGFHIDPTGSPAFTNVPPYTLLSEAVLNAAGAQGMVYILQTTAGAQQQQLISSEGGTWGTWSLSLKP